MLRFIADGQKASALHRRPPVTRPGSAAAVSGLQLEPELPGAGDDGYFGDSTNLYQGFYQMLWPEVAPRFTFAFPGPASNFGTCEVYDEVERRTVAASPDAIVYPAFQAPPLG